MINNKTHRIALGPLLTAAAIGLLFAQENASAQWSFDPMVRVGAEADDNATLTIRTDEEIDLEGLLLEASAGFLYDSQRTDFEITPRVRNNNYSDNPELESTDVFVNSRLTHETQSSVFGLRANFDRQTARTGERADTDFEEELEDILADDSGQVGTVGNREKWRIKPTWFYAASNVTTFGIELEHIDVAYDEEFAGVLEDYSDSRLNLLYRREVSDRTAAVVQLTGRSYEADGVDSEEVTGYGGQVGFDHDLSETTRIRALVGVEDTDVASAEAVGEFSIIRRLETIELRAQYRRAINASGIGRVSVRDQVNVNFTRRLNTRLSAGLGVRAYRAERLEDATFAGGNERDYVQLRSNFVWNFTPSLFFEADYRYTILDRSSTLGESSNSNRITLWLTYQPNANRN